MLSKKGQSEQCRDMLSEVNPSLNTSVFDRIGPIEVGIILNILRYEDLLCIQTSPFYSCGNRITILIFTLMLIGLQYTLC